MSRWLAILGVVVAGCIPDLDRGFPKDFSIPDTRLVDVLANDTKNHLDLGLDASDLAQNDLAQNDLAPPDAPSPDTFAGKWYQADDDKCSTLCGDKGLTNIAGPEGGYCMSGEVRPASGIAQGIIFHWGCGNNPCTSPNDANGAKNYGEDCYRPGQKQDDDPTDRTVGCFCSP